MTIQASNNNLWVRRYKSASDVGGIAIPDSAKPKTHKGLIITKGELVSDKSLKEGVTAIFNKSAGFEIVEENVTYVILMQHEIVGTDVYKNEDMI